MADDGPPVDANGLAGMVAAARAVATSVMIKRVQFRACIQEVQRAVRSLCQSNRAYLTMLQAKSLVHPAPLRSS